MHTNYLTDFGTKGLPELQAKTRTAMAAALRLNDPDLNAFVTHYLARRGTSSNTHAKIVFLCGEIVAGHWLVPAHEQERAPGGLIRSAEVLADLDKHLPSLTPKECFVLSSMVAQQGKLTRAQYNSLHTVLQCGACATRLRWVEAAYKPKKGTPAAPLDAKGIDRGGWCHPVGWQGSFRANELLAPPPKFGTKSEPDATDKPFWEE